MIVIPKFEADALRFETAESHVPKDE